MPILLALLIPGAIAGLFWSSRNKSGTEGGWTWRVRGGWAGNYFASVVSPRGNLTELSPMGGDVTLAAAVARALEYARNADQITIVAEPLIVGIPSTTAKKTTFDEG